MSTLKLLFAEIWFRKLNFLLSLMAVLVAASLFVAGPVLIDGYGKKSDAIMATMNQDAEKTLANMDQQLASLENEIRKLMLTMGFNLKIVRLPKNAKEGEAKEEAKDQDNSQSSSNLSAELAPLDMPEQYIYTLAESPKLEHVRHLVATLQRKIDWQDREALLVGYLQETPQSHFENKKGMGDVVKPGEAYLGYNLWQPRGIRAGQKIEILGQSFTVAKTVDEKGDILKDMEISVNLRDAQRLLDMPKRINQILALSCRCDFERLPTIRREVASVLPDTRVTEHASKAIARAETREKVAKSREVVAVQRKQTADIVRASRAEVVNAIDGLAAVVTPLMILVGGIWVGLLALANVRERRTEIGLLRALGKSSFTIAGLFLGKAILLGVAGGGLGYLLGAGLARWMGVQQFDVPAAYFSPGRDLLLYAILGAPLVCAIASYLPTLRAILQDPAIVLRDG